jgi:hypothetical protein
MMTEHSLSTSKGQLTDLVANFIAENPQLFVLIESHQESLPEPQLIPESIMVEVRSDPIPVKQVPTTQSLIETLESLLEKPRPSIEQSKMALIPEVIMVEEVPTMLVEEVRSDPVKQLSTIEHLQEIIAEDKLNQRKAQKTADGRALIACYHCRSKRLICSYDPVTDSCSNCARREIKCFYVPGRKRRPSELKPRSRAANRKISSSPEIEPMKLRSKTANNKPKSSSLPATEPKKAGSSPVTETEKSLSATKSSSLPLKKRTLEATDSFDSLPCKKRAITPRKEITQESQTHTSPSHDKEFMDCVEALMHLADELSTPEMNIVLPQSSPPVTSPENSSVDIPTSPTSPPSPNEGIVFFKKSPMIPQTNIISPSMNTAISQRKPVMSQTSTAIPQMKPAMCQTNPVMSIVMPQTNPVTCQTNPVMTQTNPVMTQMSTMMTPPNTVLPPPNTVLPPLNNVLSQTNPMMPPTSTVMTPTKYIRPKPIRGMSVEELSALAALKQGNFGSQRRRMDQNNQSRFVRPKQSGGNHQGINTDQSAANIAASRGNLDRVKFYAINKHIYPTQYGVNAAAAHGHIDVLAWLAKFNIFPSQYGINMAARNDHLNIMQWAIQNFINPGQPAANAAMRAGHYNIVKYLTEYGTYPSQPVLLNVLSPDTSIIDLST